MEILNYLQFSAVVPSFLVVYSVHLSYLGIYNSPPPHTLPLRQQMLNARDFVWLLLVLSPGPLSLLGMTKQMNGTCDFKC